MVEFYVLQLAHVLVVLLCCFKGFCVVLAVLANWLVEKS